MLPLEAQRQIEPLAHKRAEVLIGLTPVEQDLFNEAVDRETERKLREAFELAKKAVRRFGRGNP